jgi:hypothetical protein
VIDSAVRFARHVSVGLVALALGTAMAAPAPASPVVVPWADWVGDWTGKLTWSSCSAEGAARATISVEAIDGAVSVDLSRAGSALGELSLVPAPTAWTGQQGDVTVHLQRSTKSGGLELAVDLDSGCTVRASLTRTSTGIPACDRLSGWAHVESRCTKLTRPPLENPSRLAKQREQWHAAKGEARTKLAAQCTTRAAKLETALIAAGCAPDPDPEIGLRGAECQALRSASARLGRCGNVPGDLRAALERQVVVLVAASQGADKAALPVVEAECRQARDRLLAVSKQAGCP